jgi:hypothetical protein
MRSCVTKSISDIGYNNVRYMASLPPTNLKNTKLSLTQGDNSLVVSADQNGIALLELGISLIHLTQKLNQSHDKQEAAQAQATVDKEKPLKEAIAEIQNLQDSRQLRHGDIAKIARQRGVDASKIYAHFKAPSPTQIVEKQPTVPEILPIGGKAPEVQEGLPRLPQNCKECNQFLPYIDDKKGCCKYDGKDVMPFDICPHGRLRTTPLDKSEWLVKHPVENSVLRQVQSSESSHKIYRAPGHVICE